MEHPAVFNDRIESFLSRVFLEKEPHIRTLRSA